MILLARCILYYDIDRILKEELDAVNFMISTLEKLGTAPVRGSLIKKITSKGERYSLRGSRKDGRQRKTKLLGSADDPDVIEIKQRMYNQTMLKELKNCRKVLQDGIGKYKGFGIEYIESRMSPAYHDKTGLVAKDPMRHYYHKWEKSKYPQIKYKENSKLNVCRDGYRVRSKSEIIIYDILKSLGIPFHYEEQIIMTDDTGTEVYKCPDFLIPMRNGKTCILEHCGMLRDPQYMQSVVNKLQLYMRNGYVLNDNLFITMDDFQGHINAFAAEQLIRRMILPKVTLQG